MKREAISYRCHRDHGTSDNGANRTDSYDDEVKEGCVAVQAKKDV